jgi:hypothetical protein
MLASSILTGVNHLQLWSHAHASVDVEKKKCKNFDDETALELERGIWYFSYSQIAKEKCCGGRRDTMGSDP